LHRSSPIFSAEEFRGLSKHRSVCPTKPAGFDGAITLLRFFARHFIFRPMQYTAFYAPIGSSDLEPDPIFNVVIAYEDFETGKQAKQIYDFLFRHLGHECRFDNQMWKFNVLGIPKLRGMAAKDALMADIILIACHGTHDLSPDVKAWIDSWTCGDSNAIALVALLSDASEDSEINNMRDYLADVARRAEMEFFSQPNSLTCKRFDESFLSERGTKHHAKALSALAGIIQRDQTSPHWGINE
jgi:hypothetical protein